MERERQERQTGGAAPRAARRVDEAVDRPSPGNAAIAAAIQRAVDAPSEADRAHRSMAAMAFEYGVTEPTRRAEELLAGRRPDPMAANRLLVGARDKAVEIEESLPASAAEVPRIKNLINFLMGPIEGTVVLAGHASAADVAKQLDAHYTPEMTATEARLREGSGEAT